MPAMSHADGCYGGTELARIRDLTRPGEPPFLEPQTRKAFFRAEREMKASRKRLGLKWNKDWWR